MYVAVHKINIHYIDLGKSLFFACFYHCSSEFKDHTQGNINNIYNAYNTENFHR